MLMRWLGVLAIVFSLCACTRQTLRTDSPAAASSATGFDLLHYQARIEPDLATGTLSAELELRLRATGEGLAQLQLDNDGLSVDAVQQRGRDLRFVQDGRQLRIALARPLRRGESTRIHLRYHGKPRFGLQFKPEKQQLYTIFSTSQWLIGVDSPSERASLDLRVILPAGLTAIGNGEPAGRKRQDDGREEWRWIQRDPVPGYVMGFAAGRFREVVARGPEETTLHFLGDGYDDAQLRRVFADTADMLRYFEGRAGVTYPGRRYSQALVLETIGQEAAGFALLSDAYAARVLAEPAGVGLIAHEAAHQWWGNHVTCHSWNEFWLNEGLATFLAASYLEHRYGAAAYAHQADAWRQRYEQLLADGRDKPLVFPDWNKPDKDDRAVVYQKGAYLLHRLRGEIGEAAFWRGIALYTTRNFGKSVRSSDFTAAMREAAGGPLPAFVDAWIYGVPAAPGTH